MKTEHNTPSEFEKFDAGVRKILSVSREELKRREEEWRKEHPKPERKQKSPSELGKSLVEKLGPTPKRDTRKLPGHVKLAGYGMEDITDRLLGKSLIITGLPKKSDTPAAKEDATEEGVVNDE